MLDWDNLTTDDIDDALLELKQRLDNLPSGGHVHGNPDGNTTANHNCPVVDVCFGPNADPTEINTTALELDRELGGGDILIDGQGLRIKPGPGPWEQPGIQLDRPIETSSTSIRTLTRMTASGTVRTKLVPLFDDAAVVTLLPQLWRKGNGDPQPPKPGEGDWNGNRVNQWGAGHLTDIVISNDQNKSGVVGLHQVGSNNSEIRNITIRGHVEHGVIAEGHHKSAGQYTDYFRLWVDDAKYPWQSGRIPDVKVWASTLYGQRTSAPEAGSIGVQIGWNDIEFHGVDVQFVETPWKIDGKGVLISGGSDEMYHGWQNWAALHHFVLSKTSEVTVVGREFANVPRGKQPIVWYPEDFTGKFAIVAPTGIDEDQLKARADRDQNGDKLRDENGDVIWTRDFTRHLLTTE
jgi:hypothetical protein